MPLNIGANKIKDIYIGTNKVKEIYLGTNKVFSSVQVDPSKWNTLWTGSHKMHWEDGGDGSDITINGLIGLKPVKINADLHIVAWVPGSHYNEDFQIISDEVVFSLTIDTSDMNSNVPDYRDVSIPYCYDENDINYYYEGSVDIDASGNTVYSNYCSTGICGGETFGMAYWELKEVAQYNG